MVGAHIRKRKADEGKIFDLIFLSFASGPVTFFSCHFSCSFMSFLCFICLSHLTDFSPLLLPLVLFPSHFPTPLSNPPGWKWKWLYHLVFHDVDKDLNFRTHTKVTLSLLPLRVTPHKVQISDTQTSVNLKSHLWWLMECRCPGIPSIEFYSISTRRCPQF